MPRRLMVAAAILRQVANEPGIARATLLKDLADQIEQDTLARLDEKGIDGGLSEEMNRLLPALTRLLDAFDPETKVPEGQDRNLTLETSNRA